MLRNFETSVTSCLNAGPLTLLLFLRIAKMAHDQKEERKGACSNAELIHTKGYVDMHDLCFLDLNCKSTTECTATKYVGKVLSFYAMHLKEWEDTGSS